MILITKRTTNTVVVTLRERQTINNPTWIFLFRNDVTNEEVIFTAADVSTCNCRYQQFEITESTTVNLYQGVVNLLPGQWSYFVYEATPTSPVILDVDNLRCCEQGIVLVVDPDVPNDSTFTGGDNQINYIR